jgi:hypothetical protein
MITDFKFPLPKDSVLREQLRPVIKSLLGTEDKDALEAATHAFSNADSMAGNGMASSSDYTVGQYLAAANVDSGELKLYKNVEAITER